MVNDDEFVQVLDLPRAPLGKIEIDARFAMAGRFRERPVCENEPLEERVAGETIRAMKEGRWDRSFLDALEARCPN